jgi:hypothetical protein
MKKLGVILAAALVSLMTFASISTHSQGQKDNIHRKAKKIPNQYIVVLDDSIVGEKGPYSIADHVAADMARTYGGKLKHVYNTHSMASQLKLPKPRRRRFVRITASSLSRKMAWSPPAPLKIIRRGDLTASINAIGPSMLSITTRQLARASTSTSSIPEYVARIRNLAGVQ